jgi:hypothetical protein
MPQQLEELLHPLDRPVYGARDIARVANIFGEDGEPDERKAFHALERGYIDADKMGRVWTSTPRRILKLTSARSQQGSSE